MRSKTGLALFLGITALGTVADARNDRLHLPLANVLTSPQAKSRLDPGVQLYFGKQPYAAPTQQLGAFTANEKTNSLNKTDEEACNWVFLSAVRALQEHARRLGGNAVVNVVSFYKNQEFASETQFECGAGTFISGVALRGEVVSLK